ncbi:hypothetical protein DsansV1_C04g0041691 [Dioscorea sansibarensis]
MEGGQCMEEPPFVEQSNIVRVPRTRSKAQKSKFKLFSTIFLSSSLTPPTYIYIYIHTLNPIILPTPYTTTTTSITLKVLPLRLPLHSSSKEMASQNIASHREGAEIVNGDATCKKKAVEVLKELGLPNGLFPLDDIQEFGYNRAGGFIWLVQKKKREHTFKKIKQVVSYATEVTAFVEKGKMMKITGVKTRELLLWLSVVEMSIEDPSSGKITFKTGTGLSDSFPVSAFELE